MFQNKTLTIFASLIIAGPMAFAETTDTQQGGYSVPEQYETEQETKILTGSCVIEDGRIMRINDDMSKREVFVKVEDFAGFPNTSVDCTNEGAILGSIKPLKTKPPKPNLRVHLINPFFKKPQQKPEPQKVRRVFLMNGHSISGYKNKKQDRLRKKIKNRCGNSLDLYKMGATGADQQICENKVRNSRGWKLFPWN